MKFQVWSRPVQCSGSPRRSLSSGSRWYQRWPPASRGRASQAQGSTWRRPSGIRTRYCCSGSTPKVSETARSAPSVRTTKRSPSRRKVALSPPPVAVAPSKAPSTFAGVAGIMARAWSLLRQAACSAAWQDAQAADPTKPSRRASRAAGATASSPATSNGSRRHARAAARCRSVIGPGMARRGADRPGGVHPGDAAGQRRGGCDAAGAGAFGVAAGAGRSPSLARRAISAPKLRTASGVTVPWPRSTVMRPIRPVKAKGTW